MVLRLLLYVQRKWRHSLKQTPIEVLGIGCAALEGINHILKFVEHKKRFVRYENGVRPEEIDLFYANDFIITSHLISAEIAGYLPKGEGWKYVCEGRTAYDGDKPINTNGGRTSFGHAHAASGLADLYEAVMQMRGLCGETGKKSPKNNYASWFRRRAESYCYYY